MGGMIGDVFFVCTDIDETHIETVHNSCHNHNESSNTLALHPEEEHCIDVSILPSASRIDSSSSLNPLVLFISSLIQWDENLVSRVTHSSELQTPDTVLQNHIQLMNSVIIVC